MAESAESSSEATRARDTLISSDHREMEAIIEQLDRPNEVVKYNSAKRQYEYFVSKYPSLLAIKILKIFISSSDRELRIAMINMLSESLADLRLGDFVFPDDALKDIKPLVISCLELEVELEESQESVGKILFGVANDLAMLDNDDWKGFMSYILRLADTKPLRAFQVFINLPVHWSFIFVFIEKILEKGYTFLLTPEQNRVVQDWSLALTSVIEMGIMALHTERRYDLIGRILSNLVNALKNENEEFLLRGRDDLQRFLLRDKTVYNYNNSQCHFVLLFASKLDGKA